MMQTDHYTYRVHWSTEDNEYVATVAELPSLSWLADTPAAAIEGLLALTLKSYPKWKPPGKHTRTFYDAQFRRPPHPGSTPPPSD